MKVLGSAILIKPDRLPERTPTGNLIVPKSSKELLPEWGVIVDCGPACEIAEKGARIRFNRKGASLIVIDDVDYYFINEHRLVIVL